MIIRTIENSDIDELSILHKKIFGKTHFSSAFSVKLLKRYFFELLSYHKYKYVMVEDTKIISYLIAGIDPAIPVKIFFKKNIFSIILVLIKNPSFLVEKLLDSFSLLNSKGQDLHQNDISVYLIAVDTYVQNKGVGKTLLKHFEQQLLQNKVYQYTLAVRIENYATIEFYKKNNFIEIGHDYKTISYMKKLYL